MLAEIGSVDKIPEFVNRAKDKNDPFRLMGFGHRVYKNYDPRAKIMQKTCMRCLASLASSDDPLLEVAMELERIALTDEYFVEKKLYPNIDFYSGITLKALGFPTTMFTVLFALARTVGWIAQWSEMIEDPSQRSDVRVRPSPARRSAISSPSTSASVEIGSHSGAAEHGFAAHFAMRRPGLVQPPERLSRKQRIQGHAERLRQPECDLNGWIELTALDRSDCLRVHLNAARQFLTR
jgi:hypothetical protein